jgi:lipase chaperone LimK
MGRGLAVVARIAVGVAILGGAVLAWRSCRTRLQLPEPATSAAAPAAPRPGSGAPAAAAVAAAPAPFAPAAPAAQAAALPRSLEGTDADGAVTADAAGHLVVDLELRRLFDHFLSATGEEPLAAIRARILAALRARLPEPAVAEAAAILDQYLAYRDAARQLALPTDPRAGLAAVHELRARLFAPDVARAFFADEETAILAALDRRDVALDPALSPAERDRRIAEIDARLPAAVREARAAATAPIDELDRERAMRAAGATDQQIAQARTAAVGSDAAARLAELDRAHAAWDARLAKFRAARAALLADPQLDDAERSHRIEQLLATSFSPPERIRVEALDRIDQPADPAPDHGIDRRGGGPPGP